MVRHADDFCGDVAMQTTRARIKTTCSLWQVTSSRSPLVYESFVPAYPVLTILLCHPFAWAM